MAVVWIWKFKRDMLMVSNRERDMDQQDRLLARLHRIFGGIRKRVAVSIPLL